MATETLMTVAEVQTAKDTAATLVQTSCYWVDGALLGGVPRMLGIRSKRNPVVCSAAQETRRVRWRLLEFTALWSQSTPWSVVLSSLVSSSCRA